MLNDQGGVGDVTSREAGSGARYNVGKPDLALIPVGIQYHYWLFSRTKPVPEAVEHRATVALYRLHEFQKLGNVTDLYYALRSLKDPMIEAARVFSYGARKYAAWNWAKGMAWSVPMACALRHIDKILRMEEEMDDESGLSHEGHLACNIIMLILFTQTYPEGDDITFKAILPETVLKRMNGEGYEECE